MAFLWKTRTAQRLSGDLLCPALVGRVPGQEGLDSLLEIVSRSPLQKVVSLADIGPGGGDVGWMTRPELEGGFTAYQFFDEPAGVHSDNWLVAPAAVSTPRFHHSTLE